MPALSAGAQAARVFGEINVTTTMGAVLDGESYDITLPFGVLTTVRALAAELQATTDDEARP